MSWNAETPGWLTHFSIASLGAIRTVSQLLERRGLVNCKISNAGRAGEHATRRTKAEFSASTPPAGCARSSPHIRVPERPGGGPSDSKPCKECCASPRNVWLLPSSRTSAAPASAYRRSLSIPSADPVFLQLMDQTQGSSTSSSPCQIASPFSRACKSVRSSNNPHNQRAIPITRMSKNSMIRASVEEQGLAEVGLIEFEA